MASADNEFYAALRFTLLYVVATTPFVLGGGFVLALAMNHVTQRLKGVFIAASLLPFILTPVVGALAIKWLFRDDGLVPYLLGGVGIQVYWMAQAWSAQLLIVLYGIWHVLPFAFIVLYAGLQGVPQDALEAATIDGASHWHVQPDALPGEFRYRLLIAQSKQRVKDFRGRLQFIVDLEHDGKSEVVSLPKEEDGSQAYNLAFKFYQRVEGTFLVPPGAVIKKIQVRVLETGNPTPVSTQTVNVS